MKKIGIVTLFGNYNYGNRLQNYAVQKIANNYGYDTETLLFSINLPKELYRKIKLIGSLLKSTPASKRYCVFSAFNRKSIPTRKVMASNGIVSSKLSTKYDYFFVGSDQVWNPEIRQNERNIFFLKFTKPNQRICVSPSIGVNHIDDKYYHEFRDGLQGFQYLSCRELKGAEEIERVSGKECMQLIDPTMVLDLEEWRKFAEKDKLSLDSKYVLCFFLGDFDPTLRKKVEKYCNDRDFKLIEINNPQSEFYAISPPQLVGLINDAELVLTDSFHITAFSINLEKPFFVFDRFSSQNIANHINSRIKTLVHVFELESRYVEVSDVKLDEKCDFSNTSKLLQKERIRFDAYMRKCLDITGD